jgi:hypothetical protein
MEVSVNLVVLSCFFFFLAQDASHSTAILYILNGTRFMYASETQLRHKTSNICPVTKVSNRVDT